MTQTLTNAFGNDFLGNSPTWYKTTILAFLIFNPILLYTFGAFVAGWVLICEFIFTLAMALKCYPLPAGGLLAIEAVVFGMTHPETVYHEALKNFDVILLLARIPGNIRTHLLETAIQIEKKQGIHGKAQVIVQAFIGVWLVVALAFHLAAVGIIGLSIIVLLTALNGVVDEHQLGPAFQEALPFTALLIVFFAIVAVIHDQHLFAPIINMVLSVDGQTQLAAYYSVNGLLSSISDNVFVATVYISETKMHFEGLLDAIPDLGMSGQVLMQKLTDSGAVRSDVLATLPQHAAFKVTELMNHFDKVAVAINTANPGSHQDINMILIHFYSNSIGF